MREPSAPGTSGADPLRTGLGLLLQHSLPVLSTRQISDACCQRFPEVQGCTVFLHGAALSTEAVNAQSLPCPCQPRLEFGRRSELRP